jgi:hypothetical protein
MEPAHGVAPGAFRKMPPAALPFGLESSELFARAPQEPCHFTPRAYLRNLYLPLEAHEPRAEPPGELSQRGLKLAREPR